MKPDRVSGHEARVPPDRPPTRSLSAEALFRAHAPFVAAFVMRLGASKESVDDLVQEVFLTAHRRGGFEPGPAKPTTWLAEIAIRIVSSHKRTARRRRVVADEVTLETAICEAATPHEVAEQRDALARVQRALDCLDDERRAVFVLYELMGESCEDIAAGLAIPIGTVHSRLFAARRSFQKAHARLSAKPAMFSLLVPGGNL